MDSSGKPISGSEIEFDCDTVLLSVGLIPENELSKEAEIEIDQRTKGPVVYENMETSIPGIFACGNAVHVHDLVDFVTAESKRAGAAAAKYIKDANQGERAVAVECGENIACAAPQILRTKNIDKFAEVFCRVKRVFESSVIEVYSGEKLLLSFKRERMAPGEMERIIIPKSVLESAGGSLTISAKEA